MIGNKQQKFLTVAPFECAWQKEFKFKEAGRGCVVFEAFARNDVTVVFREHVGSQYYHYKTDSSPHYTVVLGSHRNRRLKIEVDGKAVVDVEGIGLCSSAAFQSYWISIYDGLICIGNGRYPFQNVVFQWLDSNPNCSVQYVGLSSWDKHVGYRNVNVLPLTQNHISLWKQLDSRAYNEEEENEEGYEESINNDDKWGLVNFLESWELSDVVFIVGVEEKPVPAHKVILAAAGVFHFGPDEVIIQLREVGYPILHAFLQYIYTGRTRISESQLGPLREISVQFEVRPLVKQCEEIMERFKTNKKLFDSGKNVEICYPNCQSLRPTVFPYGLPINVSRLKQFYSTGNYSDLEVYVEDHGFVAASHKIVISLWSAPFFKMFTNGMRESASAKVYLREVSPEALQAMLDYMYSGELNSEDFKDNDTLLLHLLLLADQFGITHLQQECCKILLERLYEDSVCSILQVVSSIPSCKVIEESCKRKFSMQFDYCTTASMDFSLLDEATFRSILQHPDMTVTSEERVLNAILLWSLQAKELCGWDAVDMLLIHSAPELLFGQRLDSLNRLLPLVRFPLLPIDLLKKMENSNLMKLIPAFTNLVKEAIHYANFGVTWTDVEPKLAASLERVKDLFASFDFYKSIVCSISSIKC
ncbi:BTB/POZ domain-containing protein At2g30600 isoform X2 [Beta vulgaris subsp. vulgaris]|uniref:BTB/POZ domain-containing protein At2g30600 isoform X2 n=1 Tax=Beta vulgaris subsp. vulgaris TaxID=3555 RepID=UPI0020371CBA|nr:BTB/POZ domain-containing protein At2g30600 isoform X2 [Beta vulgaris subsp. vulgaris]